MSYRELSEIPLIFNGLVVSITNICNASCDICFQKSSPKGSALCGRNLLDTDVLNAAIKSASKIPYLKSVLHLVGGEPLIYPELVYSAIDTGVACNFHHIGLTTNGSWAKNRKKANDIASKLSAHGLTRAEVSWDVWHKEHLSQSMLDNCISALRDNSIDVTLRTLTSSNYLLDRQLDGLPSSLLEKVDRITSCPVIPIGRASENNDDINCFKSSLGGRCFQNLNLTINPIGNVYPCCTGSDQTNDGLAFGNIYEDDLNVIHNRMIRSVVLRIMSFYGVGSFVPILKDHGITLDCDSFNDYCSMCWEIFSNEKNANIINTKIESIASKWLTC